ncbi:uncharacterized protein LOC129927916 isoform X2 [Biomphalaria glabrata]|uniref:Uncharacterized protein LOC129927916 isoform X2 n=1 Tax=Biomphalaria glabrata TaxID=6526 RepID=A0A9W3B854_BIOGL|nr:uncharacterized protein LOC129927916 isoform X2 [Biomphalaria glabrata]
MCSRSSKIDSSTVFKLESQVSYTEHTITRPPRRHCFQLSCNVRGHIINIPSRRYLMADDGESCDDVEVLVSILEELLDENEADDVTDDDADESSDESSDDEKNDSTVVTLEQCLGHDERDVILKAIKSDDDRISLVGYTYFTAMMVFQEFLQVKVKDCVIDGRQNSRRYLTIITGRRQDQGASVHSNVLYFLRSNGYSFVY